MQKNFYALRIRRSALAILFAALLFGMICLSYSVNFAESKHFSASERGAYTMYKQLTSANTTENALSEEPSKMNNLFLQNANETESAVCSFAGDTVRVLRADTGVLCDMALEDYVLSVLIAEMPQSFDMQALMAQAVAIRSFTVRGAMTHSKHTDADICTDYRCCQSFRDTESVDFDITRATEAVAATRGIIALYDGEPILAAYHAASVKSTKSSAEVWGGTLDYLVPVNAPEDKEAASITVKKTKKAVKSALGKIGLDGDFTFSHGGDGFCIGASSENGFLSARKIQNALSLRSDTFSVTETEDAYVFTCYGYGHGVGLSQHGANALAGQGFDFYEILKYYYTGISFGFVGCQ